MKEKVNEIINAPVLDIFEAEKLLQELSAEENKENVIKAIKDFTFQLYAPAITAKEFAKITSDVKDIIDQVMFEAREKVELDRQNVIIKRIYG